MRVALVLSEVLQGLRRNISMVISVILVTFVSLTFVGAAVLMQSQVSNIRDYWEQRSQVAIYMCASGSTTPTCVDGVATEEQIDAVTASLEGETLSPLIQTFTFDSQEVSLEKFLEQYPDYEGFVDAASMNATFWINLKDQTKTDVIYEAFSDTVGIDEVKDQLKYLDPLFQTLTVATYIAIGVAALMLIAAVLLIGTTIKLSAYARRKEIGIMRLVGASNRFIQTPFILEGVVSALIGTLLAGVAVVLGVKFGVEGYLRNRLNLGGEWITVNDALLVVPVLIGIGVVLSALSAGFAIRRWLRT
ncbi:permease-like cell division protein FtsX [Microbacterium sp. NC79]|uniref:permease-like cell division protein FtsX n=1 Tax=Microbacterium sp. NC79 TaxID=2851009 RepID=UPI001C2C97EC|nr:permease-like cell division protein FtsX [Microbacterium sp. NC79]MBV0894572.1 permease-like cell division protein FtsX [Microbacterium sp. NC79]